MDALAGIAVGARATFRKTVAESDIYQFAGVTGDFDPLHVDDEFCKRTPYGRRIAHGALIVGFMSTASSLATRGADRAIASLGFDRIRHTAPVFIGDTITVTYEITATDPARGRATAAITVTNQHGATVAVATHVLKAV